ncbi:hypothetical protein D3C74_433780 [compost metagenome]
MPVMVRVKFVQAAFQLLIYIRKYVEQRFMKVVHPVPHFIEYSRFAVAKFICLPECNNLIQQFLTQLFTFTQRQRRIIK